ncbi:Uncharacterised protein [Enterobacter cloacae]|uniref:Uncharacterized protein n=1 Tax=Enterobacter cloacae TaxID=550 RepID=A0A377LVG0_ENTCL|nr:Uncharacterised protein [Enterobacter cloacae]
MEIKLHANATTTPRIRRYLQQSDKSDRELAVELGYFGHHRQTLAQSRPGVG